MKKHLKMPTLRISLRNDFEGAQQGGEYFCTFPASVDLNVMDQDAFDVIQQMLEILKGSVFHNEAWTQINYPFASVGIEDDSNTWVMLRIGDLVKEEETVEEFEARIRAAMATSEDAQATEDD
jgi:hypothetical protein